MTHPVHQLLFSLSLSAILAGAPASTAADQDWIDLFNGQDFSGWAFDVLDGSAPDDIWSVRDGVIHVAGAGRANGVLRTVEDYGDYELVFDWRWPGTPGNSGLLIHCSTPRETNVWPRCLEVQLMHGQAGEFIHLGETITTTPEQVPSPDHGSWQARRRLRLGPDAEKAPGTWNQMRVRVVGDTVEVYVNEVLVNRGWAGSARHGAIAWQAEKADIEFRHLRLRPIRPGS